jgi:hypothetical protein
MEAAAIRPGMIERAMAFLTPTSPTNRIARSGPAMAPRLSIARSNPYARP